jgi:hypothetical protein
MTTKGAKAVTGAKSQETTVQEDVQVTVVNKPRKELWFVDSQKSRVTDIKGTTRLIKILVGPQKKSHWLLFAVNADGKTGRLIYYFSDRKDLKGVCCRSEIQQLWAEKKEEHKEIVAV